jgi:hypothetical protein
VQKRRARLVTGSRTALRNPRSWHSPASVGKGPPAKSWHSPASVGKGPPAKQATSGKAQPAKAKRKPISEGALLRCKALRTLWKEDQNSVRLTSEAMTITGGSITIEHKENPPDYSWTARYPKVGPTVINTGRSRTLKKAQFASLKALLSLCPPSIIGRLAKLHGYRLHKNRNKEFPSPHSAVRGKG